MPEYDRPKRGGGYTTSGTNTVELSLPNGAPITKKADVYAKIKDLLGIDHVQFTQIAMLAQGKFRDILEKSSEDRRKIFREIFKTQFYENLTNELKNIFSERFKEFDNLRIELITQLNNIEASHHEQEKNQLESLGQEKYAGVYDKALDILNNILLLDTKEKLALDDEKKASEAELVKVRDALKLAQEYETKEKEIVRNQNTLEALKPKILTNADEITNLQNRLAELKNIPIEYAELQKDKKSIEENTRNLKLNMQNLLLAQQALAKSKSKVDGLAVEKEKRDQALSKAKHSLEQLRTMQLLYAQASSKYADEEKNFQRLNILDKCIKVYDSAKLSLTQADLKLRKAQLKNEKAESDYSRAKKIYSSNLAGILAQELEYNLPCPVCGSINHPSPAVVSTDAISKKELDDFEKINQNAWGDLQKAATERKKDAVAVDEAEKNIAVEAKNILAFVGEIEEVRAKLKENQQNVIKAGNLAKLEMQKNKVDEKKISLAEQQEKLAQKDVDSFQADADKIRNEYAHAQGIVQSNEAALENFLRTLTFIDANLYNKNTGDSKQGLQLLGIDLAQVNAKLEDCKKLLNEKSASEESLKLKEEEGKSLKESGTVLKTTISNLREALSKIKLPENVVELPVLLQELEAKDLELKNKISDLHGIIMKNKDVQTKAKDVSSKLTKAESSYKTANSLYRTASGQISGKNRINLEAYIQMTYFDRIIRFANTRLKNMTGGQYEFKRDVEGLNARGNAQTGLELNVIDHVSSKERSVKTLSGGESFLASLALALGLADEVQASSGGIELETMFVDEGFGTLDDDALNNAMRTLNSLSAGNRLVGIISHVNELDSMIDKKIVVSKDKTPGSAGSTVQIIA